MATSGDFNLAIDKSGGVRFPEIVELDGITFWGNVQVRGFQGADRQQPGQQRISETPSNMQCFQDQLSAFVAGGAEGGVDGGEQLSLPVVA